MRPAWRREGDALFLVVQWRAGSPRSLDVRVWLKDADGDKAVYPLDSRAIGWHDMTTEPGRTYTREFEVGMPLQHGRRYTVAAAVAENPSTEPDIQNSAVDGLQSGFLYR
ncbi:hypothetical protein ACF08N_08200 [Streptomyces sp. NPDC015127]|uniref:hypothetical protein n=1 Tax=Streptomyces sp. NPDC015127 TaxID=3364939 RepID=UPI0036FFD905